ncbi:MAG: alpha/beta hydrolase [Opitutales bacterium]
MKTPAFQLTDPETRTDYHVYVEAPTAPGPWPAVAFMDGDDMFAAAVAACRAIPAGTVPPLLLVGVGYGGSFAQPVNRRGRDYTPVHHSDEPSSGGADGFLRFLSDRLWPELARRHPIDPARRGVAGHSLGSLLVLHALFQPRPFFTHFLASAPSIWWADRAILRQAAALRARQPHLPGKLFLSVGGKDSDSMTGDLVLLEQQLAQQPFDGLAITSRRFPEHNHYNVLPAAFSTGLAALFAGERVQEVGRGR